MIHKICQRSSCSSLILHFDHLVDGGATQLFVGILVNTFLKGSFIHLDLLLFLRYKMTALKIGLGSNLVQFINSFLVELLKIWYLGLPLSLHVWAHWLTLAIVCQVWMTWSISEKRWMIVRCLMRSSWDVITLSFVSWAHRNVSHRVF